MFCKVLQDSSSKAESFKKNMNKVISSNSIISNIDKYYDFAKEFIDESRIFIKEKRNNSHKIELKSDNSLVTFIDKSLEERFRRKVKETYPEHGVLGEEFPEYNLGAPLRWVIDPIDGTQNFAYGLKSWGIIVALHLNGVPILSIYDLPDLNETLSAIKDKGVYRNEVKIESLKKEMPLNDKNSSIYISRPNNFKRNSQFEMFYEITKDYQNINISGSSIYGQVYTILGAFDAGIEWAVKLWDIAGIQLFAKELGLAYELIENFKVSGVVDGGFTVLFGKPSVVASLKKLIETAK